MEIYVFLSVLARCRVYRKHAEVTDMQGPVWRDRLEKPGQDAPDDIFLDFGHHPTYTCEDLVSKIQLCEALNVTGLRYGFVFRINLQTSFPLGILIKIGYCSEKSCWLALSANREYQPGEVR